MKTLNLVDRAVRGGWGMAAVPLALALLLASHPAHAQRMPQDSWYLAKEVPAGGGGKFNYPYDVAVGPDGNIYVADYSNYRIQVLDLEGAPIRSWDGSSAGVPNNSFYPRSLHVASDGKVYVADNGYHRVLVFDAQGKFLRAMGQQGSAEGQLNSPKAITVDAAGTVYVGDSNYFVSVFDSSGAYVRRFGGSGSSDGKFSSIYDIQIVAGNKIAVLDGNSRLQFFNTDGTFSSKIEGLGNAYTFSADGSGNYLFAGWGSKVQKRSSTGTLLQEFNLEGKIGNVVYGIAVTANRIYLADRNNNRIAVLDASGNFLTSWGRSGGANDPSIFGLAADGQGNFYLGDFDRSEIRKYDSDWKLLKKFGSEGNGNGQLGGARDLAAGANGTRVYALEQNNNRVQIFDLEGNYVGKFGGPGSGNGQFNMPSGIAVGKDGKVYVADRENHRVQVFSSAGAHISSFGTQGSFDGQFQSPRSITISHEGKVAVSDEGNYRIQFFDSDGKFLSKLSNYNRPWNLEFSSDGLLYVFSGQAYGYDSQNQESYSGELQIIDQSGVFLKTWGSKRAALVESQNGDLIVVDGDGKIRVWKRTFRTVHSEPANALPLPTIFSQKRRPGTALVDVDYTVKDADNVTVQTAALAFKNGGNSLADVIPITSFAEGTGNKLGTNIATGQTHRFTWDVARDWSTDFGEVQLEILAKDGRGLLNLDFIQIPATGNQTALKISRSPLTDNDFLSVWYWLIATGDSGIKLENGEVSIKDAPLSEVNGLTANYFSNPDFTGDTRQIRVDNAWASGNKWERYFGVPFDVSSIKWSGQFVPQKNGQYTFYIYAFDWSANLPHEARVWVGDQIQTLQRINEYQQTFVISCEQGQPVPIRIEYKLGQNSYYHGFWLNFAPPGESERGPNSGDFKTLAPPPALASGTSTSASGRAYLFQKMGLREATAAEVTRAKEAGTPGVINQWEPKLRVGPDERPAKINAYGFDTGADGCWVVPVSGN